MIKLTKTREITVLSPTTKAGPCFSLGSRGLLILESEQY
jgi:hypothetical protein